MKNNQRGFGSLLIFGIIAVFAIFGTGSQIVVGDNNRSNASNVRSVGVAGNMSSFVDWLTGKDVKTEGEN